MSTNLILSEVIFLLIMFILGAIFGSFTCCQAWRIYYRSQKKDLGKWSVCLNCGKRLKPQENIPLISWLVQKGKCKKCGAKIGAAEILSEIGLGLCFAAIGALFWPEIISTSGDISTVLLLAGLAILMLAVLVVMWILLIYDAKWRLLPTKSLAAANILAVLYLGVHIVALIPAGVFWHDLMDFLPSLGIGVAILAGTYFCLYKISSEKLVGSGDWLLALAVSLILGNWWLCLLVLFLSNFFASIAGIILKIRRGEKTIPFGPFLILAFVIVYALQNYLSILFAGLV